MKLSGKLFSDRRLVLMVWIVIFLMKLSIGISHILAAQRGRIAPLQFGLDSVQYRGPDPEVGEAFDKYSKSITRTIDAYQRNSQRGHILAAYGYLAAALTSLASIVLELRGMIRENGRSQA